MSITKYIGSQFANPRGLGGKLSTFFMNKLNKVQYKSIEANMPTKANIKCLDIGFGNGYLLSKLSKANDAKFWGIEISKDMLMAATEKNKAAVNDKKINLSMGNAENLAFEPDFFDYIYTVNTLYFWKDADLVYKEVFRTLKKGGIFANAFYSKDWLDKLKYTQFDFIKYTQEEVADIAKKVGFGKVELITLKQDTAYCLISKK